MCLAVPAQIVQLQEDQTAKIEIGGLVQTISVALIEDLKVGDYVLVHVGYALTKMDEEDAQRTLAALRELEIAESRS